LVRKALNVKIEEGSPPTRIFYLVESHVCPSNGDGFKLELKDDETFETDFIGASEQDCQKWAQEKQFQVNFIEQDIIAIADARSARDDTLLMQYYARELDSPEGPLEFEEFGVLPREHNTWYDFRIDYKGAATVYVDLTHGPIDTVYPTYFGRKEELTDERGAFNVAKARRLVRGEDPDTPQA
jgi:hypothetical protein